MPPENRIGTDDIDDRFSEEVAEKDRDSREKDRDSGEKTDIEKDRQRLETGMTEVLMREAGNRDADQNFRTVSPMDRNPGKRLQGKRNLE